MSGKGRMAELCENTTSVAGSCVQRNLQRALERAAPSHAQPAQLESSFPLSPLVQLSLLQKGHGMEGMKANGIRTQLLQLDSPVLSVAAARGHYELAAQGKKFLAPSQPTASRTALTCLMREVRIAYVLLRLLSRVSTQLPAGRAVCTSS